MDSFENHELDNDRGYPGGSASTTTRIGLSSTSAVKSIGRCMVVTIKKGDKLFLGGTMLDCGIRIMAWRRSVQSNSVNAPWNMAKILTGGPYMKKKSRPCLHEDSTTTTRRVANQRSWGLLFRAVRRPLLGPPSEFLSTARISLFREAGAWPSHQAARCSRGG